MKIVHVSSISMLKNGSENDNVIEIEQECKDEN